MQMEESFITEDGELVEALRCPETELVLYMPYFEAIYEQSKTHMNIVGFKRPTMVLTCPRKSLPQKTRVLS